MPPAGALMSAGGTILHVCTCCFAQELLYFSVDYQLLCTLYLAKCTHRKCAHTRTTHKEGKNKNRKKEKKLCQRPSDWHFQTEYDDSHTLLPIHCRALTEWLVTGFTVLRQIYASATWPALPLLTSTVHR